MGYTKYSDIGNEVSIINDQEEVFIGVDTGPITFAVFYELDSMVPDFLGTINLNYGPLSDIPLDISLLGYIEKENYELSTIVSKVFQYHLYWFRVLVNNISLIHINALVHYFNIFFILIES